MSKSNKYFGKERLPTPPPGKFHSGSKKPDPIGDKRSVREGIKEYEDEQSEINAETEETEESENR